MTGVRISLGVLTGLLGLAWTLHADPPVATGGPPKDVRGKPGEKPEADTRVSVALAQDRAKLMHDIYSATLDSMHHHFFRRDRAVLPARALDDVFAEVDRKRKIKSRWIAVNTPAMSLNHEPETAFEKKAAEELAAGKAEVESTENGYYLRAAPIPLGAGCVSCHTKFGATDDKKPRFAGLVISIPVKDK
jgi:cytochrome c553